MFPLMLRVASAAFRCLSQLPVGALDAALSHPLLLVGAPARPSSRTHRPPPDGFPLLAPLGATPAPALLRPRLVPAAQPLRHAARRKQRRNTPRQTPTGQSPPLTPIHSP